MPSLVLLRRRESLHLSSIDKKRMSKLWENIRFLSALMFLFLVWFSFFVFDPGVNQKDTLQKLEHTHAPPISNAFNSSQYNTNSKKYQRTSSFKSQTNGNPAIQETLSDAELEIQQNVALHSITQPTKTLRLRFDWTNLTVLSPIAKLMVSHQSNCTLPLGNYFWRKKIFGLGSDLHVWSAALCNAIEDGLRIRTHNVNPWVWVDSKQCNADDVQLSTLSCYFPHAELQCPEDRKQLSSLLEDSPFETLGLSVLHGAVNFNISNPIHFKCNKSPTSPMNVYSKTEWRAAGTEALFSRVSPLVQKEAERQLNLVFPSGKVPPDLITVHMRWGDKKFENKVSGIDETLDGIRKIRLKRGDDLNHPTSILLCTEDPKAVMAFQMAAPKHWKIYLDQFYNEMLPHRPDDDRIYNKVPKISRSLNGKTGLWSLGSLLVAMEANSFVLVLSSNWSRLMDELRRNVLNPRCHNCTHMVNIATGKWQEW
jgi:hypothetical protein